MGEGAPWADLLLQLGRLAPTANVGIEIDQTGRQMKLSLSQAVSASPAVSLSAEIAMSFAEAAGVGRALAERPDARLGGVRDPAAERWLLFADDGPAPLVGLVAVIRTLMRPSPEFGARAHA